MHSRIFKLTNDLTTEYEEIKEYEFENNGFLNGFHDYVNTLNEKETKESYDWLIECMGDVFKNFRKEGDYYYVDVYKSDLKAYLENTLDKIKEIVEELKVDEKYFSLYKLQDLTKGDESGFYFYICDYYSTDIEFVVDVYNSIVFSKKEKYTFRLEGALDYHS